MAKLCSESCFVPNIPGEGGVPLRVFLNQVCTCARAHAAEVVSNLEH